MSTLGKEIKRPPAQLYRITVYGKVDQSWSEWFSGLAITTSVDGDGMPITHLVGTLPDQGALRGILNSLWDLNLSLLSVNRNDPSSWR
jgi:hypothetical protein